jgi:hypothetical protein
MEIPRWTVLEREVLSGINLGEAVAVIVGVIVVVSIINRIRRARMLDS